MTNFDDFKLSVEALSGGKNTVILDDIGMPSIVVPFPKLKYSDLIKGGTEDVLPAFIVDGIEIDVIYVSKYQNIVVNDRAYSLPFKDPKTSINFDTALKVCRNKGLGWHLLSNALWATIQNWCYKNNTPPHGNTNYGYDYRNLHEKGVVTYKYTSDGKLLDGRTATGSGPVTWYHNYDSSGIADLCGNVWEWVAGFRLVDGEIQVIPNGNCMKIDCNMSNTSTEWKTIMIDGILKEPATQKEWESLKYDIVNGVQLSTKITNSGSSSRQFGQLSVASDIKIPQILEGLGLFPVSDYTYGDGHLYVDNRGERLPLRGAGWYGMSDAGVAALNLNYSRAYSGSHIGFRAAFYEKL
ncbi:hypothetical protein KQI42_09670 [Tissierella sp. MSJ-40]|uniref:Sulfatase-modifying factor enzyme domain-containing protein n=1 Tax=Tissierella simiarum TaxID=2841534 RepID=A0ABS6E5S6_9FIRM|nr:hypothetical protein [Tissierella simiarum]MBU5438277.1 hypothetical protein [Tissierella simiarum]